MEKIWFIKINDKEEGPYSALDLKKDLRITPDTFVWRRGFKKWKQIRNVAELKKIFKDKEELENFESEKEKPGIVKEEILALQLPQDFPPVFFWLVIILLLALFLYYRINS